ncbi:sulfate ABC transporter permease subunit CysW [Neisseriaceae bacterium PsAf]|nr:sulfate ABC transporter permease subunit CysW [Neisseriaceae bacterium PsAf]MCV2502981.1 sulfate ABC transporter permease subunit CysW [Neisseriaceae bacterium]
MKDKNNSVTEPKWVRCVLIFSAFFILFIFLIIPLISIFYEALYRGWDLYVSSIFDKEALKAIQLSLLTVLIVVPVNVIIGVSMAWLIARFDFKGKAFLNSLIDLPFAVSPVVAGLMLVLLLGSASFLGSWLESHGMQIIFAVPGIILATLFVTFPFVARELIPLMESQGSEEEQAALILGARSWDIFFKVTLPNIKWGLIYGIILVNARALGEFGAVSIVSGHIRGETNTVPLQVEVLYSEYNYTAAFTLASLLALMAIFTLLLQNVITWNQKRLEHKNKKLIV